VIVKSEAALLPSLYGGDVTLAALKEKLAMTAGRLV